MIGSIRWNILFGTVGFLLTFLMSVGSNFIVRALLNSAYSFLILFAVVFALRWILGTLVGLKGVSDPVGHAAEDVGNAVNETTPDDQDQLNDLLKNQLKGPESTEPFVPLQPKKLASVPDADPEQLAQALRQLKEE
ncbi:hypothetical protein FE784_21240 [Paenibacillus hemerocallicola]|uniref:Uncharacterized protein n=1 Tax=Paenibacillus hemerocallicola TaxID=1172614 RepID=A0A5C4T7G0_9BACL|nr:hypothetical protein [Paenibacillus hemerocallicola]TNJ64317.1 hypothetical protein FE784_21240 [Paenibacillus hemerocallicola]